MSQVVSTYVLVFSMQGVGIHAVAKNREKTVVLEWQWQVLSGRLLGYCVIFAICYDDILDYVELVKTSPATVGSEG